MTNEEAIEYNKNLREYMRITDTESEFKFLKENYEALDMAIKVLEQIPDLKETYNKGYKDGQKALAFHLELCKEEQEPCEDCISRKRLKECFHKNVAGAEAFDTIIDMQPSIQPKPKEGHWVEHGVKEGFLIEKYTCSECDYYSGNRTTNFCPNCGAKMVKPQESEE